MPLPLFRRAAAHVAAALAALLLTLCAGAVWSVVTVFTRDEASFMVVPTIYVARYAVSRAPFHPPLVRAALAAVLVALATAYAQYLHVASLITAQLGVPFGDSIVHTGPALAWMMSTSRIAPVAQIVLALAPVVAAIVVLVENLRPRGVAHAAPPVLHSNESRNSSSSP